MQIDDLPIRNYYTYHTAPIDSRESLCKLDCSRFEVLVYRKGITAQLPEKTSRSNPFNTFIISYYKYMVAGFFTSTTGTYRPIRCQSSKIKIQNEKFENSCLNSSAA